MVGKILLTVVVVLLAFVVLRQRALADAKAKQTTSEPAGNTAGDSLNGDLRLAAYFFLVLMVGIGAALYYYRWQDDHTILTITLHRDNREQPVTYQVYKYQLGERSFITIDGTSVTVAGSERMEIEGLAE